MSDNNYQEVIKNNKLFDGIPPQNLNFQFRSEQIIRKKEGEIIFQKGDESRNTYLVIAGIVKIKVYIENKSVKLNKSINDFFGEIEVLEETYRRSAAVANTDCILYSLSKSDLRTFLAEIPEINDNIIAYNRVEIPELQITIRPGLLKDDTDKLYVTPRPENKGEMDLSENTGETAEEIINKDNGMSPEDLMKSKDSADEYPTDKKGEENTVPGEVKEMTEPSDLEISPQSETEEELGEVLTEENEITVEGSSSQEDTFIPNGVDSEPDEYAGHTEEPTENTGKEISTDSMVSEANPDMVSSESEIGDLDNNKRISLNASESEEAIPDEISEEEKLLYEAEDEKLKYDDTEINAGRILSAIKMINSTLDKHIVYANIVREATKLTEAQAGVLYRVDVTKNLLITDQETEEGYSEVSYTFSNGLTGLAAETGEIINVREPIKDFRYSEDIDSIRGIVGSSLLCVPVKNYDGNTIAVICLANSSSGKFSISDEEKISLLVPHVSQTLQCLNDIDALLDENKHVYLSTLTKFITDNIQTPVLTMKYYAGQIRKKSIPQDVRTVLSVLMDQADSVVDFLHSTLAFTENRNPLNIQKCSLQEVMDDALGLLAEYVESRNVGLYKKVESNINVKLDKKAFYQACHQIAKNACDAMGENGNIYITAKQSGDLVNIEFRDTGPGIPDQLKTQIFLPFKKFKKDNGTGLGLTIAQRIIRDHGGELTVESNPGQGATFIISLPVFDEI